MSDAEFAAAAARDREARRQRARQTYQDYALIPIPGGNYNSPEGFDLLTPGGTQVRITGRRALTLDGEPYGDQKKLDAINARLEEMQSDIRDEAKHILARRLLWLEMPEYDPARGGFVGEGVRL